MSTFSDPPVESFQLSQLFNDTRYRSYTFQFIALILLVLFFRLPWLKSDKQPSRSWTQYLVQVF